MILAVDRNRELRLDERVQELEVLAAGMAGYVGILQDDLCMKHTQLVDDLIHRELVTRNRVR